jgi:hypothetical protein
MFRTLLTPIRESLSEAVNNPVREIFIPGNHDCVLPEPDPGSLRHVVLENLLQGRSWTGIPGLELLDVAVGAQKHFFKFLSEVRSDLAFQTNLGKLFWTEKYEVDGSSIAFNCFNTAWMSSRKEKQGSLFAYADVELAKADFTVTLMHHPPNWLHADNAALLMKKVEQSSDVILTGHEHLEDSFSVVRDEDMCQVFRASVLQEHKSPQMSGFCVFHLDTRTKELERQVFKLVEGCYRREDSRLLQVRRTKSKPGFTHTQDFRKFLDDPGSPYSHPRVNVLTLEDLYVWPTLTDSSSGSEDGAVSPVRISAERIVSQDHPHNRIVVVGSELAGKTALAKMTVRLLTGRGLYPLWLTAADLKKTNAERLVNLIRRKVKKQYEAESEDSFLQLPPHSTALIVDEFELNLMEISRFSKLLAELEKRFGRIFLFASEDAVLTDLFSQSDESRLVLKGYRHYDLCEFGFKLRAKLIEKWHRLGRPESEGTNGAIKITTQLVDTLLGRNMVPPYPMFVLSILQGFEANQTHSEALGAFGYHYELLIMGALDAALRSEQRLSFTPDAIFTALSYVAYSAFSNGQNFVTKDEFTEQINLYHSKHDTDLPQEQVARILESSRLLRCEDGCYYFKYEYVLYYFLAKYFQRELHSAKRQGQARDQLAGCIDHLHVERNANALIFVLYLTRDELLIEKVLEKGKSLFARFEPEALEKPQFLTSISEQGLDLALPSPSALREDVHSADDQDETDEVDSVIEHGDEGKVDIDASEINVALKCLQIMGQIVRNNPGALEAEMKLNVVRECYDLGLRIMSGFLTLYNNELENFRDIFVSWGQEQEPDLAPERLSEKVKSMMYLFPVRLIVGIVKRLSASVGSEHLRETYYKLKKEYTGHTVGLIDVSIKVDHFSSFPVDEVIRQFEAMRGSIFHQNVLQLAVVRHFLLFPETPQTRSRVAAKLGIQISTERVLNLPNRMLPPRKSLP